MGRWLVIYGCVAVSVTVTGRMTGMDLWLQLVLNAVVTSLLGWLFSIYGFFFRRRLAKPVEDVYVKVRNCAEPLTLNPVYPGNKDAIFADARDGVNRLRPRLKRALLNPPNPVGIDDRAGVNAWFTYLQTVRGKVN